MRSRNALRKCIMSFICWRFRIELDRPESLGICLIFGTWVRDRKMSLQWRSLKVEPLTCSLTPMGVRALGARMRENWNTPLTLFGYLLFHMLASPYSSARRQSPMYMPELVYTSISSYFLLLLSPVQRFFVAPAVSADSHEQCQSKIGHKNWEPFLHNSVSHDRNLRWGPSLKEAIKTPRSELKRWQRHFWSKC